MSERSYHGATSRSFRHRQTLPHSARWIGTSHLQPQRLTTHWNGLLWATGVRDGDATLLGCRGSRAFVVSADRIRDG